MREVFESPQVSQILHAWVDLIFGIKQKDQEAEKNLNTFPQITYEDGIDTENMEEVMLKSYE